MVTQISGHASRLIGHGHARWDDNSNTTRFNSSCFSDLHLQEYNKYGTSPELSKKVTLSLGKVNRKALVEQSEISRCSGSYLHILQVGQDVGDVDAAREVSDGYVG